MIQNLFDLCIPSRMEERLLSLEPSVILSRDEEARLRRWLKYPGVTQLVRGRVGPQTLEM